MIKEIDLTLTKPDMQLRLAKPDKTIIGNLKEAFNRKMTLKLGQVSELEFSLPLRVEQQNLLIDNPNTKKIRQRYLIKAILNDKIEWFIINKIAKSMDDQRDIINVSCKSLAYELYNKRIKDYVVDATPCTLLLTDILTGTGWSVGTVDILFISKYRSLNLSNTTKLDAVLQIADSVGGIPFYNSDSKTVDIIHPDNIGINKGLKFSYGQYLKGLDYEDKFDDFCTRLRMYGKDNMSMNSVNPTGQTYIESFAYFLYPFERDVNRNVIKHSEFMSDSLAHAIVDYTNKIDTRKNDFSNYLTQKSTYQTTLTTKNNELKTLETQLKTILDSLAVTQQANGNTTTLNSQKTAKEAEIATKKSEIQTVNTNLTTVDSQIASLRTDLSYATNFTSIQLDELGYFIIEKEISESNIDTAAELYDYAKVKFSEFNTPPIDIKISIVNFLDCITEQRNWSKLVLGDQITIVHEKLGVNVRAKIEEVIISFDDGTIDINITTVKKVKDAMRKFIESNAKAIDATNNLQSKSINWNFVANNFNSRNDRISVIPADAIVATDGTAIDHTINSDGSANISFEWSYNPTNSTNDQYDIDGFVIYVRSLSNNEKYIFGSTIAQELVYTVPSDKRALIVQGVPANKYYTFGIQAYRHVDQDINVDGVLKSQIVKSTNVLENPYQPATNISFSGDITGTINGTTVGTITTAITNFNTRNDRKNTMPANPIILADGTAIDHTLNSDGSSDISFEWQFTGTDDAHDIDGFIIYVSQNPTSAAYTFGTTPANEQIYYASPDRRAFILYGVAADKYYTFGVQAYRSVDQDINASGLLKSQIVKSTGVGEDPYRPSTNISFTGNISGTINGQTVTVTEVGAWNGSIQRLDDIANDSKLTPVEKQAVKKEWDAIVAEKPTIVSQADTYTTITTEKTNYINAFTALGTYLNNGVALATDTTVPNFLTDLTTTIVIDGATFRSKFKDYFDKKAVLLKNITDTAKLIADSAQSKADSAYNYAVSPNVNLLQNGNSEICTGRNGVNIPDGWTVGNWVGTASIGRRINDAWTISGNSSFEINTGAPQTPAANHSYYQDINGANTGVSYTLSALMGAHRCTVSLELRFFNSSGTDLGMYSVTLTDTTTPTLLKVTQTSPSGTSRIRVEIRKTDTLAGQTSSYLFADQIKLEKGTFATPYIETGNYDAINNATKSSSTIIVADGSTSSNALRADYVVPAGSSNAQDTINNAINSLPANGGKVVLLEGTYLLNGLIRPRTNITIEGQGIGTQLVRVASYQGNLMNADNISGVNIRSISIDGKNGMNSSLILLLFTNCTSFLIEYLTFNNCQSTTGKSAQGITFKYSNRIEMSRNNFVDTNNPMSIVRCNDVMIKDNSCINGFGGVYVDTDVQVKNIIITANRFTTMTHGIQFSSSVSSTVFNNVISANNTITDCYWGVYVYRADNVIISNNSIDGGQNGIQLEYSNASVISGNIMKNCLDYGIVHYGDNCIFSGNSILGYSQIGFLLQTGTGNNIQSNIARKLTYTPTYGIKISDSSCVSNRVTDNDFYNSGVTGAIFDGGVSTTTASGNRL